LRVRHVIVCGHYGCGGVAAALKGDRLGLIDNWLRHAQAVRQRHEELIHAAPARQRADRLGELNVIEQVVHVAETTVVHDAWARGQELVVHGWIYDVADGLLRDLGMTSQRHDELRLAYRKAVRAVAAGRQVVRQGPARRQDA
jgi:carbonic anhydrase